MNISNFCRIPTLGLICAAALAATPVHAQESPTQVPVGFAPASEMTPGVAPTKAGELDSWHAPVDGAVAPRTGPRTPVLITPQETASADADTGEVNIKRADFNQLLRERMHYDMQEGTVWAMGGDYKASAGPDGFTFMPFLGSDAPKTFEHRMRLSSATLGGESIQLDDTALVQRTGDRVTLDRGPVDVFYDMSTGSVEQSFELQVGGINAELVLDIAVDSDGAMEKRADGIYYTNALGGVIYSHAVVIDGAGQRLEIPIEATKGNVRLTVPARFMRDSVAPVLVDPIVATYQINAGNVRNLKHPDVAYDLGTDTFAYVHQSQWSLTDYDVWMETYNGSTGVVADFQAIDFTSADIKSPNVASDNTSDQFLVVSRRRDAGLRYELVGRTVNALDISERSPIFVVATINGALGSSTGWENFGQDVGGKSQGTPLFKVIWNRIFYSTTGNYSNIRSVTVTPVTPFSALVAPTVNALEFVTNSTSSYNSKVRISESSGESDVAEWRSAWSRIDSVTGAKSIYTMLTADDNTQSLAPTPFIALNAGYSVDALDVTEGLTSMDGPLSSSPVSLIAVNFLGPNAEDVWLYGIQDGAFFEQVHLTELEHQDVGRSTRYPTVAATQNRFTIAFVDYDNNAQTHKCYSTSVDLTNQGRFAVCDRRTVVAELGNGIFIGELPAAAARYSGGRYTSRYVGTAVTVVGGAFTTQHAAVVFPSQAFSPAPQYCAGIANSTGDYGFFRMGGNGNTSGTKTLYASSMPLNQFGYFMVGHGGFGTFIPSGSVGTFCLGGGAFGRYNQGGEIRFTGGSGEFQLDINPAAIRSNSGNVVGMSGQTYNFQAWHRENGGSSNFTNAVSLQFN